MKPSNTLTAFKLKFKPFIKQLTPCSAHPCDLCVSAVRANYSVFTAETQRSQRKRREFHTRHFPSAGKTIKINNQSGEHPPKETPATVWPAETG